MGYREYQNWKAHIENTKIAKFEVPSQFKFLENLEYIYGSTPYSKMAAILVFFCLLANKPLPPDLREHIL